MTTPLAVAPSLASNAAGVPYLTVAEYQNAPTAVNSSNLVTKGTVAQNKAELANIIARASSWIDDYCNQVIAATSDIDPARRYRINSDGILVVPLRFTPIRLINSVSVGASPSSLTAVSASVGADIAIGEKTIEIPAYTYRCSSGRMLVQVSYVSGYPNTISTAAVAAATSLPVADRTGIIAGDQLTVYDDANGIQQAVVAPTWVAGPVGPGTVPLVAPVSCSSGISVSALPPAVKQAAIFATTSMLKTRGSASIQMQSTTQPNTQTPNDPAGPDLAAAKAILGSFMRAR